MRNPYSQVVSFLQMRSASNNKPLVCIVCVQIGLRNHLFSIVFAKLIGKQQKTIGFHICVAHWIKKPCVFIALLQSIRQQQNTIGVHACFANWIKHPLVFIGFLQTWSASNTTPLVIIIFAFWKHMVAYGATAGVFHFDKQVCLNMHVLDLVCVH